MNSTSNSFNTRCYELLKQIPEGKVTTYAEIARALNTKAYRAVGNAMAKNKDLFVVPCHRVVRSNGDVGNYALGAGRKVDLLMKEGVEIEDNKVVNMSKVFHGL
jgi:methylated-DNA-[protein]-cysteine S-methyltransferase